MRRVPLAWKNLTHNRLRFVLAMAGVGFAVFLMFAQYGFRNALFDSTVELVRRLDGELVLVNQLKYNLNLKEPFTRRRLYQALAVDGVRSAQPVYIESNFSEWRSPDGVRAIRAIGIDPDSGVLTLPGVQLNARELHVADRVLFDAKSKPIFGPTEPGTIAELSGDDVTIAGTFQLGTDFTAEGNVIMSQDEFQSRFASPLNRDPLTKVDLGVIKLLPGANIESIRQRLQEALPSDVKVMTKAELTAQEIAFWQNSTPIGFAFGFGVAMGFVVGVVICYQILSTDVADHLPEYATLKAIGYPDRYLTRVVLQEALILSLLGFVPGLIASWGLYQLLGYATGLPMYLTIERMGMVLILTLAMCAISGMIALRKVQTVDPAEVF